MPVERKISEATQASNPIDTDAELPTNYNGLARKITVEQILLVGDTRFGAAGARTPTAHAASHASAGSDPVTLAQSQVTNLTTDLAAKASASDLSTHTGLTTSAHGGLVASTDPRLTDSRTPTSHASSHNAGGGDALAIDAAAGTGSLRTLGTSSTSACAGNDSRLSDSRTPTAHATSHKSGGSDSIKLDELAAPTDVTTLNASSTAHGLQAKLPSSNAASSYQRGDGTWVNGQIQFPATQNASSDANCLDDYEEGTFTPGLSFGSGQSGSFTITAQTGHYRKIGSVVMFRSNVTWTAVPAAGSTLHVDTLPFTVGAQVYTSASILSNVTTGSWTGSSPACAAVEPSTTYMTPQRLTTTGSVPYNVADMPSSGELYISGFYFV